jgi:crotonobetainyl-CoA:carnitine CoA-transferase CaiB-like acyl-CoA transferase
VLDLTQAWIGPMAGVLLADLGAQVIKVEGLNRPDIWRLLGQVEEEPGETPTSPLNRSRYFNGANRSKRGLALDLGHPAGAEAFLRLVAEADVVLENFTPGVMRRFGLDFARLSAVRPDLVMTSFSGFGAEGPHAGFKANGASIEALAGWAALHRDAEGRPVQMGGYPADPMCGLQMAASTLVALYRRARGGGGAHVEGSMLEAASGYLGDVLLAEALARAGAESADDPALQVRLGEIAGRWAVEGGAGPVAVATTWEALADPRLRDWLIPLASPGRPDGRHPGYLWRFADAPLAPASPPPRLGEHTAEVLSLCLSTAEVAALVASGVAGTVD